MNLKIFAVSIGRTEGSNIMKTKKIKYGIALTVLYIVFCATTYAAIYDWPTFGHVTNVETISLSGVKGQKIEFSCKDLEFKLGLATGSLNGITVTALPGQNDGTLSVDDKTIHAYDNLSRSDIDSMVYVPMTNSSSANFTFIPDCAESIKTTLAITLSDKKNLAPQIESASFDTIRNVPLNGTLSVYDAEGDKIKINLVSKPAKGEIVFEGASFHYTPFLDTTGTDSFNFVCIDEAGNYSREGNITINIEKDRSSFSYQDMKNSPSHYSAIKLYEKNILTGKKIGANYFFEPQKSVSRGELLVMILATLGLDKPLTACVNTGLENDSKIPLYLKPYVKVGMEQKIITEQSFKPDEVPTRAEAVVMIDRAANIQNVKKQNIGCKDLEEIPIWALQSYMNLSAYKMLDLYDGYSHSRSALTRDVSADLLWQLWKYNDSAIELK
ncbi:MAG: hypothetical protein K0R90_1196 [Oscillospiraceae bacterium]|nr:hypothetical protein [Oscillospiraceae bacterium]